MNSNDSNNAIMNNHHPNNSIMLGQFFPASLFQSSASLRRLTSASSDSGDSGVDPSYRQERKIFVGGVPSSVGPEELAQFFQSYGQVEEAFIIYDRYSGRHRGFGFVTFTDMATTKSVCSTRIFNLHGRKIECKRALKREDLLGNHEHEINDYKLFHPYSIESSSSPTTQSNTVLTSNPMATQSVSPSTGPYRTSTATGIFNTVGGWLVHPSMQPISPMYHPLFNTHQPYALFSLPTLMWNDPYQGATMCPPFVQDMMVPGGTTTAAIPSPMINL